MAYRHDIATIKADELSEAKKHKEGCYGLSMNKLVITKDESGEYELIDLILSDLGEDKFTCSISKTDLLRAIS